MTSTTSNMTDHHGSAKDAFLTLKKQIHRQLIESLDRIPVDQMSDTELRTQVRQGIEELCFARRELLSHDERMQLVDDVLNEVLGMGPLEVLFRDPTVSDILINGPRCVFVERHGRLEESPVIFHDEQHLVEIVRRLAARAGRRLDEASPMVDARLEDGSRLNAVIRPLAVDGALVSIRRFPARALRAGDLVAKGALTSDMVDFLAACVRARLNVIVSGGTGSGKTTLLNVLSGFIPGEQRIATIEDAAELQFQHRHVARMETRAANLEGRGEVTIRDLVRNALRMRPDRIIIGECRGGEAFDMLQAMNTGHDGSLATIHANDCRHALSRLEMLVGMSGYDLPLSLIQRQIASTVNIVVQTARLSGGKRKVVKIAEITGYDEGIIAMHDVFRFEQTGVDQSGTVEGRFVTTGVRPNCLELLSAHGCRLPAAMFEFSTRPSEDGPRLREPTGGTGR